MKQNPKMKRAIMIGVAAAVVLLVAAFLTNGLYQGGESIQAVMRDAVLHEHGTISLFGLMEVNPAVLSAFLVTGTLLLAAALIRIFAIPKFKNIPGKLQLVIETIVDFFTNIAKSNSPHHNRFLSAYIFAAGTYIFVGTMFELLGLQAVASGGQSLELPAPLSDINAAIALGCLSYLVIVFAGIHYNGMRGLLKALKDFSLPISMSFRLFGALLSGLLVTELVYHYIHLSFILPVVVAVIFTLLHALIQTYVLVMLTSLFYGEVAEPKEKPISKKKKKTIGSV